MLDVAHKATAKPAYGTPISLPLDSLSAGQNHIVAIPDTPGQNAGARSNQNLMAKRGAVIERAKSESPELTVSVNDYPSSQSPRNTVPTNTATLESSQLSSTTISAPVEASHSNPVISVAKHPLRDRYSAFSCASESRLAPADGFHVLRSAERLPMDPVDPIETDEGPSQEIPALQVNQQCNPAQSPSLIHKIVDPARRHDDIALSKGWRNAHPQANSTPGSSSAQVDRSNVEPQVPKQVRTSPLLGISSQPLSNNIVHKLSERPPIITAHDISDSLSLPHSPERGICDQTEGVRINSQTSRTRHRGADEPSVTSKKNQEEIGGDSMKECRDQSAREVDGSKRAGRDSDKALLHDGGAKAAHGHELNTAGECDPELEQKLSEDHNVLSSVGHPAESHGSLDTSRQNLSFDQDPLTDPQPNDEQLQAQQRREVIENGSQKKYLDANPKLSIVANAPPASSETRQETVPFDGMNIDMPKRLNTTKSSIIRNDKPSQRLPKELLNAANRSSEDQPELVNDAKAEIKLKAEDRARREADAVANFLARAEKLKRKPSSEDNRQMKSNPEKLVHSSRTGRQRSLSSGMRNEYPGKRRSMTPLYPSSSALKPRVGASKASESSKRRSVSFNDDPLPPPGALKTPTSTLKRPRNGIFRREIHAEPSSSELFRLDRSGQTSIASTTPAITDIRKICEDSKSRPGEFSRSTTTLTTPSIDRQLKPKIQTKLNVIRDRKLKGRAGKQSSSRQPAKTIAAPSEKKEVVPATGSPPKITSKGAEAGPSGMGSTRSVSKSATSVPSVKRNHSQQTSHQSFGSNAHGKPSVNEEGVMKNEIAARTQAQKKSRSRSPACYLSRDTSKSSELCSPTVSRNDIESRSSHNVSESSEYESNSEGTDLEDEARSNSDSAASYAPTVQKQSESRTRQNGGDETLRPESSPKALRAVTKRTPVSDSKPESLLTSRAEDEKQIARELDQQLRRERAEAEQGSGSSLLKVYRQVPGNNSSMANQAANNKLKGSRFPTLTKLKGEALNAESTNITSPKPPAVTDPGLKLMPNILHGDDESSSSSSESDEEDSSSEQKPINLNGEAAALASQGNPKSRFGPVKGWRSILKRTFTLSIPGSLRLVLIDQPVSKSVKS